PIDASGVLQYTFNAPESGVYTLYARVICPNADDDSFWLKMDNGDFASWNNIESSTSWTWAKFSSTYNLSQGVHTLTIGYREDGAKLDKLWLTHFPEDIEDEGSEGENCKVTAVNRRASENIHVYPNPVSETLNIGLLGLVSEVTLYNFGGQVLLQKTESTNIAIDMNNYQPGIYFIKIADSNSITVHKIIKR